MHVLIIMIYIINFILDYQMVKDNKKFRKLKGQEVSINY